MLLISYNHLLQLPLQGFVIKQERMHSLNLFANLFCLLNLSKENN